MFLETNDLIWDMTSEHLNNRALPPLNALRAFEAAARHGALHKAARELGVTPGAVSQQVRQLEAVLGVELFHREGRGVRLTEQARAALPSLSEAFDRLRDAAATLTGADEAAPARVGACIGFGLGWLAPRLARLGDEAHAIIAEVVTGADWDDLDRGRVDLFVTFGPTPPSRYESRRLMDDTVAPAIAPHTLRERWNDDPLLALREAPLVHEVAVDGPAPEWPDWLATHDVDREDVNRGHRALGSNAVVDTVAAGLGIGLVRRAVADAAVADGRVALIYHGGLTRMPGAFHVVWPKERALGRGARAALAWLEAEAAPFEHHGV